MGRALGEGHMPLGLGWRTVKCRFIASPQGKGAIDASPTCTLRLRGNARALTLPRDPEFASVTEQDPVGPSWDRPPAPAMSSACLLSAEKLQPPRPSPSFKE